MFAFFPGYCFMITYHIYIYNIHLNTWHIYNYIYSHPRDDRLWEVVLNTHQWECLDDLFLSCCFFPLPSRTGRPIDPKGSAKQLQWKWHVRISFIRLRREEKIRPPVVAARRKSGNPTKNPMLIKPCYHMLSIRIMTDNQSILCGWGGPTKTQKPD